MTVKDFFCKSDFEKVIPYLLKHGEKYRDSIPAFKRGLYTTLRLRSPWRFP